MLSTPLLQINTIEKYKIGAQDPWTSRILLPEYIHELKYFFNLMCRNGSGYLCHWA
jgi:Ca2+-binding EF-hand superfamily protein